MKGTPTRDSFPKVGSKVDMPTSKIATCAGDMPLMDPRHPVQPALATEWLA